MRKAKIVFSLLGIIMLGICATSVMAGQTDFSGTWELDKGKTHGLPKDLKGDTMVVTQNEQQLVVQNQVNGSLAGPGTLALSMLMPQSTYSLDGKEKTVQFPGQRISRSKPNGPRMGKHLICQ